MPALLLHNAAILFGCLGATTLLLGAGHLIERGMGRRVVQRLGWRGVLLTGWIGVPVHELSHLLAAKLFNQRIVAWSLFDPDPATGTLGYVRFAYRRRTPWQLVGGLFVALAPVAGGALALMALFCWMLPAREVLAHLRQASPQMHGTVLEVVGQSIAGGAVLARDLAGALWAHRGPWLPVQLYLCVCVASHMSPSGRDLAAGRHGMLAVAALSAALVAALSYTGVPLHGAPLVVAPLALLLPVVALFQAAYVACVLLLTRTHRATAHAPYATHR